MLRAQAHEFANQLHTISGLIQIGEFDEVGALRRRPERRRPRSSTPSTRSARPHHRRAADGQGRVAAESGVELTISDETTLERSDPGDAADVATVLGNLVDNALDTRRAARHPRRGSTCGSGRTRAPSRSSCRRLRPRHARRAAHTCSSTGSRPSASTRWARRGARAHPAGVPAAGRRDPRRRADGVTSFVGPPRLANLTEPVAAESFS